MAAGIFRQTGHRRKPVYLTREIIPDTVFLFHHLNSDAEMIRQAVAEAAIDQAVGRVRGVNRTEGQPVEVYMVLGDTVVPPLQVDAVEKYRSMEIRRRR